MPLSGFILTCTYTYRCIHMYKIMGGVKGGKRKAVFTIFGFKNVSLFIWKLNPNLIWKTLLKKIQTVCFSQALVTFSSESEASLVSRTYGLLCISLLDVWTGLGLYLNARLPLCIGKPHAVSSGCRYLPYTTFILHMTASFSLPWLVSMVTKACSGCLP